MPKLKKIFLTLILASFVFLSSTAPASAHQLDWFVNLFRNSEYRKQHHDAVVAPLYPDGDKRKDLETPRIPEFTTITGIATLFSSFSAFYLLRRKIKMC